MELNTWLPGPQSKPQHHRRYKEQQRHPKREPDEEFSNEDAACNPIPQACTVGKPEVPRNAHEAYEECEHADAACDAMKREVEMRMQ